MGRLGNAGNAPRTNHSTHPHPSGNDPRISHFSHPHPLELTSLEQALAPPICAGCASPASGCVYSCKACNYVLDVSCAKMPRRIRHPAHPHSLNLFATPPSKEGPSNCDACGRSSSGFTFYCDPCGFWLHCQCAAKPLTINHRAHPHPLNLVFSPPYEDKGFSCDICGDAGLNHWLYRCAACEFDAHIGCATGGTLQPPARTPQAQQQAPARTPTPRQQQASPRPSAPRQQQASPRPSVPRQQASPRPSTPQQQAARRPRTSQQQGPRLPTSQQQGFQRPFAPQQLVPPLSLLPPGLLQPLRPLLPPGLLQPPRRLWTQPPQMNQATQGSNNSVEQQNGEGTESREQQNGEGTKSEEHHNGEGTESVEHHNDDGDIPDTTGEEEGDVGGSSSGYHWNQDGCDDGSDWMMTQDGGYDESSSVPEDPFGGSDESYEVNMEVTFEL